MQTKLTLVKKTERVSAKTGKPFTSLSIKTEQHGDKFLSGFSNKDNANWKEGDMVDIDVTEVAKDGKTYLNFTTPKKEDAINEKAEMILNKIVGMKLELAAINAKIDRLLIDKPKVGGYPTAQDEGIDIDDMFPDEPDAKS